jgi:hypothetical protein
VFCVLLEDRELKQVQRAYDFRDDAWRLAALVLSMCKQWNENQLFDILKTIGDQFKGAAELLTACLSEDFNARPSLARAQEMLTKAIAELVPEQTSLEMRIRRHLQLHTPSPVAGPGTIADSPSRNAADDARDVGVGRSSRVSDALGSFKRFPR